jgi:trk system potassium uptake protein TrkA
MAEAIELVAHGDQANSHVVGRSITEIKLPPGAVIGAIVRKNNVIIADYDFRIEQDDHVILFLSDKNFVTKVERLFQPSPFFL